MNIIKKLSCDLRKLARNRGIEIDDIYRNTNGITLQMQKTAYVYSKGRDGLSGASVIFKEVCQIKEESPQIYKQLLWEANKMIDQSDLIKISDQNKEHSFSTSHTSRSLGYHREAYLDWLINSGMNVKAARNYGNWLNKINEYALDNGFTTQSIYEYEDAKDLLTLYYTLIENDGFVSEHKDFFTSLRKYLVYRSEGTIQLGRVQNNTTNQADVSGEKRAAYQDWLVETGMASTAARNYGNWLNKIDFYAVSQGYCNKSFYEIENTDEILSLYNKLCLDEELMTNHRYYFTSLRKYITYRSEGTIQLGRAQAYILNQADATGEKRAAYQDWLVETGMASAAARNYGNWLNKIDFYAIDNGYSDYSVYEIESIDDIWLLHNKLCNDQELMTNHRDYFTSLRKYITYRREINSSNFIEHKENSSIDSRNEQSKHKELIMSAAELDQYSQILCNNFGEGLVINAIGLDKFRMFYEDEFGIEPTSDDDELIRVLKAAGSFIGDRIFPKHDDEQSDLIEQIIREVVETLKEGARCVYLSSVLSRWRQELVDQLNIYNQETLRALIQAQNIHGLVLTDNVLKLAWEKAYPEENVVECLKEVHKGVNYQYLQRKIWYIPLETIKRTLVTSPEIVLVDAETYFYAPNFPATTIELHQLTQLMKAKIDEKGFLVSKDIYNLIHSGCHSLAINTEGYKDWAYRNILKYLLRDEFEFSGSVVSSKGQKLEMYQVYKSFCRDYKHLTVNELEQFSHELGVQIYWESVLTEMIRINANELVNRNQIHFDVEAIDNVLDEMCPEDYIPIKDVGLFLHFPAIEVPWNSFVLESYLLSSDRFTLYHASFSKQEVYGVLIRKNTHFKNYEEVIIDLLAHSNEWTNAQTALQLIVEKGCQARRRWENFDRVLQKAIMYREEIEQKEV